jgi:hypothetical protein
MSGRPVHLLAAAALAVAASTTVASAGCFSGCGSSYGYAAPVAYYTAPVVYSYSYAAPVSYAAPCSPCGGYASYGYGASYGYAAPSPVYVVNQGPSFNAPVIGAAEQGPAYEEGAYPAYYGESGIRWHRHHWHRGYGYRDYGYGYRSHRYGYRSYGHRARFGYRSGWRARHMIGPGGTWRRGMHRMHGPRMGMYGAPHMHMNHMHMNRMPGVVHPPRHMSPMGGPKKMMP